MLADSSMFTRNKEVDAAYRVISYNANQVSEKMYSGFKVIKKLVKI